MKPGSDLVGPARRARQLPRFRTVLIIAIVVLAVLWAAPTILAFLGALDLGTVEHLYAVIFAFVVFDAVIPIFPSESLLTTGANLAAQEGSDISVWRLAVAGSLGAVVGDSLLYWLSRTALRRAMSERVERARENEKVARALETMGSTAPTLIVFGRFVPGLRFVVAATMGLTRYPYPRFLLWDAIGGVFWATYTCAFSYLVASVIADKPVLSIAISVVVTTALLGLVYVPLKRSWDETATERPTDASPA